MIIIKSGQRSLITGGLEDSCVASFQPDHDKGDSQQAYFRKQTRNLIKHPHLLYKLIFLSGAVLTTYCMNSINYKIQSSGVIKHAWK